MSGTIYSVIRSSISLSSQGGSTGTIRANRAGEGESRGSSPRFSKSFFLGFFLNIFYLGGSCRTLMDISKGIL